MLNTTRFCFKFGSRPKFRGATRALGMTKQAFENRRGSPSATKPWRYRPEEDPELDTRVSTSFITDVASRGGFVRSQIDKQQQQQQQQQLLQQQEEHDGDQEEYDEDFSQQQQVPSFSSERAKYAPLGFRSFQQEQPQQQQQQYGRTSSSSSSTLLAEGNNTRNYDNNNELQEQSQLQQQNILDNNYESDHHSQGHQALPVGKDLSVQLEHTPMEQKLTDTPIPFLSSAFDTTTRKTQIVLPKHLNNLFAKISKWSSDLDESSHSSPSSVSPSSSLELDNRTGTIDHPSPDAVKANPKLAKHAMTRTKERLQYGALMDAFESDRHALENKISVAGAKFERRFMNWQGTKLLENVPQQEMHDTKQSKGTLLLHSPQAFKIPRVNHDGCPGCGATIQNRDEHQFGYCYPGDIEQYVLSWQSVFRARKEYADRMTELMAHWEKHGKRVGEEWLDFMTQDEFNAVFRFVGRPFMCRRCVNLRSYGISTTNTIMTAPDFKGKLASLRDKRCLVVLVIDLCDFPGSMVAELPGLISMNNPVIIAANKLDGVNLIDFEYRGTNLVKRGLRVGSGYLRQWVREQAIQFRLPVTQIKSVVPVSAHKGWGIRELIDKIEFHSNLTFQRPDQEPLPTYFVGVSNVGKSSVINAIAHHLYVPQPPHPTSKKQYFTFTDPKTGIEKVSHRWVTDKRLYGSEMDVMKSTRSKRVSNLVTTSALPGTTINSVAIRVSLNGNGGDQQKKEEQQEGKGGKKNSKNNNEKKKSNNSSTYFYDTPGLHPLWHETSPFNLREQVECLMKNRRNPQATLLSEGYTLFFSAGACIDVVKAKGQSLMFFAYHSQKVTTNFCATEQSDAFWKEHAGRILTPPGSRLTLFPEEEQQDQQDPSSSSSSTSTSSFSSSLTVKRSYLFECYENHRKRPKADIYFCGLGWVSFFAYHPCDVVLRVRTLPGIVHGVRRPLRKNDMKPFRPWPHLPANKKAAAPTRKASSATSSAFDQEVGSNEEEESKRTELLLSMSKSGLPGANSKTKISDVIELENNPDSVDLSKPPILPIKKQLPFTHRQNKHHLQQEQEEQDAGESFEDQNSNNNTKMKKKRQSAAANAMPFEFILSELTKQGKIKGDSK